MDYYIKFPIIIRGFPFDFLENTSFFFGCKSDVATVRVHRAGVCAPMSLANLASPDASPQKDYTKPRQTKQSPNTLYKDPEH